LTTVFGLIYAAAVSHQEGAILEVETDMLDQAQLLPDEDFLSQCVTMHHHPSEISRRKESRIKKWHDTKVVPTIRAQLEQYAGADWLDNLRRTYSRIWKGAEKFGGMNGWEASLRGMGTCAYKGAIPPSCFKRIAFFNKPGHPIFKHFRGIEVTIEDYRKRKEKLEKCNRWLFGEYRPQDWNSDPETLSYKSRDSFRVVEF